ncbi:MAG: RsiV family protein [Treponema sp.]|nr:RsiV family protein [Treponema sp.]
MEIFKKTGRGAVFCMLFAACAGMDSAPSAAGGREWKNVNSESVISLYPGREGEGPEMRLTYRLLDLPGSGKEARTLRQILYDGGTPEAYRDKSGEALRNEYFGMRETAEPGAANESLNWFYTETAECSAESPRYAVIRRTRDSYLGGAHGMRKTAYFLIGRGRTGRIPLDRIIKEGAGPALLRLIEEGIRRHFDIAEGRPLTDVLFDQELELPDNFFPGPEGLGFHWDPYEIAPYSTGPVELFIPWDRCAGLLSGEGLRIAADFGFY